MKSRIDNSIRNTTFAMIGQIGTIVLSFLTRTIFIACLGASYLGINGLFTNILSLLSFAELGFGTAIVYALYKPLAENNQKEVAAYMNFYAHIYRLVGIFIFIGGLVLVPFLSYFIDDTSEIPSDIPPLWVIYILYLLNSSASYFFNYKRSLITASQNGHLDSLNTLIFTFIRNIFQIIGLIVWRSFVFYLLVQILCTLLGNIAISVKANQLFPYLNQYKNERLDSNSLHLIIKNVIAMACHKLGSVIVSGTDNILISKFVGIVATGYYSNYTLITSTVRTFYLQLFSPITASVGNFIAEKGQKDRYCFFKKMFFVNAYIAIFCTACLTTLINPFITLLWGKQYVFSAEIVGFIMLNFYITCMRQTTCIFIDTNGLFWQVKWKSVLEALINLIASFFFAHYLDLGILGVIIGTTISTITTNFWWEPYVVFKDALEIPLRNYFKLYVKYTFVVIISVIAIDMFGLWLPITVNAFVVRCSIAVIMPNFLVFILFRNTPEYEYCITIIKHFIDKTAKKFV